MDGEKGNALPGKQIKQRGKGIPRQIGHNERPYTTTQLGFVIVQPEILTTKEE